MYTNLDQTAYIATAPTKHLWVVMGPCGTGKSTIGKHLSTMLGFAFVEGDDHHPAANKAKMAAKTPLNDNDRMPWLEKLSSFALNELSYNDNVVVACSALKVIYRNVFRQAVAECPSFTVQLHFLYLQLDEQATMARVGSRKGHFMPAALVRSQYEALEEPTEEELGLDCMVLNSRNSSTKLKMMSLEAVSAWLGQ